MWLSMPPPPPCLVEAAKSAERTKKCLVALPHASLDIVSCMYVSSDLLELVCLRRRVKELYFTFANSSRSLRPGDSEKPPSRKGQEKRRRALAFC